MQGAVEAGSERGAMMRQKLGIGLKLLACANCLYGLAGVWLLFVSAPVWALDWRFGGFGTASGSCFTSNKADYVLNLQPVGPGRSSACHAGIDSILGLQLDVALSDTLEIGAQAVADLNADRSYTPELNIGQVRWKPIEHLTLRLGRTPTASFLHAENRLVRYAMPWVRPPIEVYGLLPAFYGDGLEAIYANHLGAWNAEWHGGVQTATIKLPESNSRHINTLESTQGFLNLTLQRGHSLVKMSYVYGRVSFSPQSTETLFSLLKLFAGPAGGRLASDLAIRNAPYHLLSIGARYERDDWLLMGEFGSRLLERGFVRDQYGAYVTVARQLGAWTPYATLARRWTYGPKQDARAGLLQPAVEALLTNSVYDSSSVALGLARTVTEHATLKFQVDWIKPDGHAYGLYTNHAPTYNRANPSGDFLFTVNLDFIF
jgi:hypothetical protein